MNIDNAPHRAVSGAEATNGSVRHASGGGFTNAWRHVQETVNQAVLLLTIQKDRAALAYRRTLARTVVIAVAAVAAIVAVIASVLFFVNGVVDSLTVLFDGRDWLARLVGGAGLLTLLAVGLKVGLAIQTAGDFKKQRAKYEDLRNKHRARFGPTAVEPKSTKP